MLVDFINRLITSSYNLDEMISIRDHLVEINELESDERVTLNKLIENMEGNDMKIEEIENEITQKEDRIEELKNETREELKIVRESVEPARKLVEASVSLSGHDKMMLIKALAYCYEIRMRNYNARGVRSHRIIVEMLEKYSGNNEKVFEVLATLKSMLCDILMRHSVIRIIRNDMGDLRRRLYHLTEAKSIYSDQFVDQFNFD